MEGGVGFRFLLVAFLVRDGVEGRPSQEGAEEGRRHGGEGEGGGGGKEKVRETSLLSDLQFPRHLTEGAGQTKVRAAQSFPTEPWRVGERG